MSLKGKKIPPNVGKDGTKTYKKPFRKTIKIEIKMDKDKLRIRYLKRYLSLKGKNKEIIRENYKNIYKSFFLECGYKEEKIIPQLEKWEKELKEEWKKEPNKVISFEQYIKKQKGTRTDGRTME